MPPVGDIGFEDITRIQLKRSKHEINLDLDDMMESYYNDIVIPEIQSVARAANTPDEFVQGFKFVKTGKNKGKIINTWGSADLPLAKFFNYGTKKNYLIEPKVVHAEKSPRSPRDKEQVGKDDGDSKVIHPSVLKITLPDGSVIFRPYAIHPGIEKSLAMETGTELGTQQLIPVIQNRIKEKYSNRDG